MLVAGDWFWRLALETGWEAVLVAGDWFWRLAGCWTTIVTVANFCSTELRLSAVVYEGRAKSSVS